MNTTRLTVVLSVLLPLALAAAIVPAAPAGAPDASLPDPVTRRYVVRLRAGVARPAEVAAELLGRHGGVRTHVYERVFKGFAVVDLPAAGVEALRRDRRVLRVDEDQSLAPDAVQPLGTDQAMWGLDRMDQPTGQDHQFTYFYLGTGVRIYVLDSGIDGAHEEFENRLPSGANTMARSRDPSSPLADDLGHGTAVASAAAGNSLGVARGATLYSVKVNVGSDLNRAKAWESDVLAGLEWVQQNGEKPGVVILSYRGSANVRDAMQAVHDSGFVVVKSAGDLGRDACDDPANQVEDAIVVGATNTADQQSSFSNHGPCVTLLAPGEGVRLAAPGAPTATTVVSGTSFAAPYVAGVAAAISELPGMTPDQVRKVLTGSASAGVLDVGSTGSPDLLVHSQFQYVTISGDNTVGEVPEPTKETWSANALGGDGIWTYRWEASIDGVPSGTVQYGSTYTRTIHPEDDFKMQLMVYATSAGRTVSSVFIVYVKPYPEPEPCTDIHDPACDRPEEEP